MGVLLAPRRNKSLFSVVRNNKKPYSKQQRLEVYKLPLYKRTLGQQEKYIGMTAGNL